MVIYVGHFYERLAAWEKTSGSPPRLRRGILESIDAALWLIAGGRIPHALVSLVNAVEIAFKSELERVHRLLVADNRKLDYQQLKGLLREAFLAHPRGKDMNIPEFEIQRTILFSEAMDRAEDLYPMIRDWKSSLKEANARRNDIVHYGSSVEHVSEYTRLIAIVLFPFLDGFLRESNDLALEAFVTPPVYRELQIAREIGERLRAERTAECTHLLNTVAHVMKYTWVDRPEPTDRDRWVIDDGDRQFEMAKQLRNQLRHTWGDSFVEVTCHVCPSVVMFAKVEPLTPSRRALRVLAAECPSCGLSIHEKESYLAEYHVGPLADEIVESFLKDIDG